MRFTSLGLFLLGAVSTVSATAFSADTLPAGLAFKARGDGWVLADAKGMTLYTFERDVEKGKSSCNDDCAIQWPPVAIGADVAVSGDWSAITREDGARQLAFRGQPLYAYQLDAQPGDAFGDGVARNWSTAFKPIFTPPEARIHKTSIGRVLADQRNLTLYVSDFEKDGNAACDAKCLKDWAPVAAPWAARSTGDWTAIVRADGTKQWAFRGRPLYHYRGDAQPGQVNGEGLDGKWHALVLEPPLPLPAWVRVHESDAGELYTDATGKTLYQYQQPLRRQIQQQFPEDTVQTQSAKIMPAYKPVLVEATGEAKPGGNWSMVERDGKRQWAFKGLPLFTNDYDVLPGDLNGFRGSSDRSFHTIMVSGEPMQGTGQ
ncbi:MAG: hypothetical protein FJX59_02435 [Alphaproteobacteria bacterium]|nr:hypothetical protein [Alphaproteobacteria bacterium]